MANSLLLPSIGIRSGWGALLLVLVAVLLIWPAVLAHGAESAALAIKVDQVGYPLHGPKVALVGAAANTFQVRRSSDDVVVFHGKLTPSVADPDTQDLVQAADFSSVRTAGSYYLQVPGVGRSWNFAIGPKVYERTYYLAMRGFYGQRCGTAVDLGPEFSGYSHPACHLHGEFHISSGANGPSPDYS
jgi:endoglucanase